MQGHIKGTTELLFFTQGHCVIPGCGPTHCNIYIDKLANMISQSPWAQPTTQQH